MLKPAPFQIYNASAGSGKTFSLVKNYLSILLGAASPDTFKHVLAITFTNKAVNEMKQRVLSNLHQFSEETIVENPTPIFEMLVEELKTSPTALHQRAQKILTRILHNYAFFDIVTIDKFNHRLLRTFAFDLKLPTNFEVSLDEETLLNEAVDNLIYQAGTDKTLTRVLIDFALEKADDDKSWDIARDLNGIAKLLSKEEYIEHIKLLEGKTLSDFNALGNQLKNLQEELLQTIKKQGKEVLELMASHQLDASSFNRGTLYNHFKKVSEGDFYRLYENKLQENLSDQKSIYTAKTDDATKATIDGLIPTFLEQYLSIQKRVYQYEFLQNFYKNLIPLSLLNAINAELIKIKEERNLLLISEFNKLISGAISNQPAPFIYERIGEKYKHYFIDEFQDTSTMQWENIRPLVSNALEAELPNGKTGTLLIVGDAKQAIYRWRGGKAEQFIDLYREDVGSPFQTEKKVTNLPKNYRSFDEIVSFNNRFFNHISQNLRNETYKTLFEKYSYQETNETPGGHISFTFIDADENKEAEEDLYQKNTLDVLRNVCSKGFQYSDICILTRKKKEGLAIADYLTEMDIPIISSETLLLKNDRKVSFLVDLIQYFNQPDDAEIQYRLLNFIAEKQKIEHLHSYISTHLNRMPQVFSELSFLPGQFLQLPLYNAVEYAINAFGLAENSDAYLQFFLDEILTFTQNNNGSLSSFLAYWEQKKDNLSIVAPENSDAVQIMTIHKSKGLEFPVVIFPYANTDTQYDRNFQMWFPVDESLFGLKYALFDKKSAIANISEAGTAMVNDHEEKLELDNYNLLYVALTRPVEQLHIVAKKDINRKGLENTKTFAGLFINYLKEVGLWNDSELHYSIGPAERKSVPGNKPKCSESIPFISNMSWNNTFKLVTKAGSLWGTDQQKAIDRGNLYHFLLSKIVHADDVAPTVDAALGNGIISENEKGAILNYLNDLVNHPSLKPYFSHEYTIFNERELFGENGQFLRPDRFMVKNGTASIIDYKTGAPSNAHRLQIDTYAHTLTQIGYTVEEQLIVYINDEVQVVKV